MRTSTRIAALSFAGLVLVGAGCSSDDSASDRSDAAPATAAAATDAADSADAGTGETTAAAPAGDAGEWPPADMCTVLPIESVQALTGETVSTATPNDGANAYGPYCDYLSDKSGLFMSINSFSPDDMASYSESVMAQGRAVALPGVGDSALLDADPTFNDSTVYVTAGNRAFSVHVTSQTDNGWTPEITTEIATAVATAMLAG